MIRCGLNNINGNEQTFPITLLCRQRIRKIRIKIRRTRRIKGEYEDRERNLRLSSSAWLEKVLKFGRLKLRIKSLELIKIDKNLLFTFLP